MAEIISTDFDLKEVPFYAEKHGYTKYADIREALLDHGKVKLGISNPDGLSLTMGVHEGGRIYQALRYWFSRRERGSLRGRIKGETLWLWVEGKED